MDSKVAAALAALDDLIDALETGLDPQDVDDGWSEELRGAWLEDTRKARKYIERWSGSRRGTWFAFHAARQLDHDGIEAGRLATLVYTAQARLSEAIGSPE